MSIVVLLALSVLLLVLTVRVVSRRRLSAAYTATLCVLAVACDLLIWGGILLPLERIELFSVEGKLVVRCGKWAVMVSILAPLVSGVLLGCFAREESSPRREKKNGALNRVPRAACHMLLLVLLVLTQAYIWGRQAYPNINIDEIVFYLQMPLQGTAEGFVSSLIHSVFLPALICFAVIECMAFLPAACTHTLVLAKHVRIRFFPLRVPGVVCCPLLALWLAVMLVAGDRMLDIRSFLSGYLDASLLIEEEYVDPASVAITFPQEKRNLITIYLESGETTPQDIQSGGVLERNLIPEMTRVAQENVSFSQSELIEGASVAPECSWTIAGLIAQSAGVPLKTPRHNFVSKFESVLPGVVTLGDILKREGYRNVFMAGSNFTFGGRRLYYEQHGDYEIWDYLTAKEEGKIPQDYYYAWGFEDRKLFAFAKEKLTQLAADDQPFHFAMLTVDAHSPGYRCDLCPTEYIDAERDFLQYADVLRCSSAQLEEFVKWLKEQEFYENTSVVIAGDHASMQSFFYDNLNVLEEGTQSKDIRRLVYNAFINSAVQPVQEKNRVFTTIDFFPTVLASMGVTIEGERLGLGTNLFSSRKTLSEECGEETFFEELRKRSAFYEERLLYPPKE